jgi:hypothetical protein
VLLHISLFNIKFLLSEEEDMLALLLLFEFLFIPEVTKELSSSPLLMPK